MITDKIAGDIINGSGIINRAALGIRGDHWRKKYIIINKIPGNATDFCFVINGSTINMIIIRICIITNKITRHTINYTGIDEGAAIIAGFAAEL